MKKTIITMILAMCFVFNMNAQKYQLPQDNIVLTTPCDCSKRFSETKEWNEGKRGGYFCLWTITRGSKKGQKRKRYFSELAKRKKR